VVIELAESETRVPCKDAIVVSTAEIHDAVDTKRNCRRVEEKVKFWNSRIQLVP